MPQQRRPPTRGTSSPYTMINGLVLACVIFHEISKYKCKDSSFSWLVMQNRAAVYIIYQSRLWSRVVFLFGFHIAFIKHERVQVGRCCGRLKTWPYTCGIASWDAGREGLWDPHGTSREICWFPCRYGFRPYLEIDLSSSNSREIANLSFLVAFRQRMFVIIKCISFRIAPWKEVRFFTFQQPNSFNSCGRR